MKMLTDILYWISTGLMIPVIILLIVGFVWSITIIGGFYGSYLARRRLKQTMADVHQQLENQSVREVDFTAIAKHHPALHGVLKRIAKLQWNPVHAEKQLVDFELQGERALKSSTMLMRLGPMLGLMGTLIPMGPALVGLASGDIASMAAKMQVAFATTVIGIFVGGVGFVTLLARKGWFVEDTNQLRYIIDLAQHETG